MNDEILDFVNRLAAHDGFPPLSEAKEASLSRPDRFISVRESDRVVAVGAVGLHTQSDGSIHAAVETAVEPSMRFEEFEDRILEATLDLVPNLARYSVWSRRSTLEGPLVQRGWEPERTLLEMAVDLPLSGRTTPLSVRAFAAGDESTLVQINAEAFGGHREAGALDLDEVRRLATQPWFDPEGVFFYPREGEVGAFCWTKVHPNGEGEIYRIGVGARLRGQGVGKAIVEAGFEYLASMRGCRTGFLWVDSANDAAMRLYRSIGMTQRSRNIEFTRKADRT